MQARSTVMMSSHAGMYSHATHQMPSFLQRSLCAHLLQEHVDACFVALGASCFEKRNL